MQVLTTVASLHDLGTLNHSQCMIALAEATARHLQRSEEELHLVHLGALLHKPGPLTDDEWKVMRKHPEIGRQILQQAGGIFGVLARIVVAHHERWDGAGYPLGLTQETIPPKRDGWVAKGNSGKCRCQYARSIDNAFMSVWYTRLIAVWFDAGWESNRPRR